MIPLGTLGTLTDASVSRSFSADRGGAGGVRVGQEQDELLLPLAVEQLRALGVDVRQVAIPRIATAATSSEADADVEGHRSSRTFVGGVPPVS